MAVPKKRRSKSKRRIRRALWTVVTPNLRACSNCGTKSYPHRACTDCGFYKGKQVIVIKQKKSKEQKEA